MEGSPAWDLFEREGIRVGTASWTDKTLIDSKAFYPRDARSAAERLAFYAENFPLVEVDSTYYGLPAERNAELWAERTPDNFVFNVKAFALLTQHPANKRGLPKDLQALITHDKPRYYPRDLPPEVIQGAWDRFLSALRPLQQASKLGSILFQFPEWFPPSRENRDYLVSCGDRVAEALPGVACAVEFRQESWMRDAERQQRTLELLSDHGLPFVCVDMPQGFRTSIPPVAAATAPLAMVRFHGRRNDTWGRRNTTVYEKFGYEYPELELQEWQPRIAALASEAREVHVLMNNCYSDYAIRSARTMAQLL
jgi:uncharacterized protein YecE (DUF72 family)